MSGFACSLRNARRILLLLVGASISLPSAAQEACTLTPWTSTPTGLNFPSAGALAGDILVVADGNSNPMQARSFKLDVAEKALTPLGPAQAFGTGSYAWDTAASPDTRWVAVANFATFSVTLLEIDQELGAVSGTTASAAGGQTTAVAFSPDSRYVAATSVSPGSVMLFALDSDQGTLSLQAQLFLGQNMVDVVFLNKETIVVADAGAGDLKVFQIDDATGALELVGTSPAPFLVSDIAAADDGQTIFGAGTQPLGKIGRAKMAKFLLDDATHQFSTGNIIDLGETEGLVDDLAGTSDGTWIAATVFFATAGINELLVYLTDGLAPGCKAQTSLPIPFELSAWVAPTDNVILVGDVSMTQSVLAFELDSETTAPQVPDAADNLTAVAPGPIEVILTWQDNSTNEDGFAVQRAPAGSGDYTEIARVTADVTTFRDKAVAAETGYDYRVIAFNTAGEASPSNVATVTTPPASRTAAETAANHAWHATGGDPVSTLSGELFFTEGRLLDLGGPLPVFLQLYFAAFLERDARIESALGPNWSHNFDARLIAVDLATIEAVSSRGRVTTFEQKEGAWQQVDPLDFPLQLVADGAGFVLGDPRSGIVRAFDANGRLTTVEDARGNTLTLSYDAHNRLASVSDGLGRTLSFTYEGQGRLASVIDGMRTVTFGYDGEGRLTRLTNPEGETTTYAYEGTTGYITAATQPNGSPYYTQVFDSEGRVLRQSDAHGSTWQFAYEDRETTVTDPNGDTFTHRYSTDGRLETYTDPFGSSVEMTYEASGRRSRIADRLGGSTRITYHSETGLPEMVTEANGGVTTYSYSAFPFSGGAKRAPSVTTVYNLTGATLPDGGRIDITRDDHGNPATIIDPAGESWSFTYEDRGQVLTATNPEGGTAAYTYNADATLAAYTDAAGNTTSFSYDPLRRLTRITQPDGASRGFGYDDADRLLSLSDEDGRAWTFAYDDNGNVTRASDPSGLQVQYEYDAMDRLTRVTDRTGGITEISYDLLGRPRTVTDPNGYASTYGYDALSRLTSLTDGDGKSWQIAYDAEGLPVSLTDPEGISTTFTTNEMGWVTQVRDALGNGMQITYDAMGRPTGVQDPQGLTTAFGRDALGRTVQATLPGGAAAMYDRDGLGLVEQVIDPNGGVWEYERDAQGRLIAQTDPLNRSASYTYDSRNRPSEVLLPGGVGTLSLTYNATGAVAGLAYSDGTGFSFDRDAIGRIIKADGVTLERDGEGRLTVSNGLAIGRDDGGRVASVTYAPGRTITYGYDARGLVTSVTDWLDGTTTLAYDGAGRLVSIARPNGVTTAYIFDAAGRLVHIEETSAAAGKNALLSSTALVRDARGQVTSATRHVPAAPERAPTSGTWTADASGQIEGRSYSPMGRVEVDDHRTYTWDLAGRLTSYVNDGTTVEAEYDAFGYRTRRSHGAATREFAWNYALRLPSVAVERDDGDDRRYYIHTPDGVLLYSIDAMEESRWFYHYDEMGNTDFVTDDASEVVAAYAYSPYGDVLAETGSLENAITWQGMHGVMREEADLYYVRARYYAAADRRFLSPDPIKSLHPAGIMPYGYARANPQRFVDPTGLAWKWPWESNEWAEDYDQWYEFKYHNFEDFRRRADRSELRQRCESERYATQQLISTYEIHPITGFFLVPGPCPSIYLEIEDKELEIDELENPKPSYAIGMDLDATMILLFGDEADRRRLEESIMARVGWGGIRIASIPELLSTHDFPEDARDVLWRSWRIATFIRESRAGWTAPPPTSPAASENSSRQILPLEAGECVGDDLTKIVLLC